MTYLITYNGDCNKVLKEEFKDESVGMIFTDPPYGISNKGSVKNSFKNGYTSDKGSWDTINNYAWVAESVRVLRPGGIFAVFGVFGSLVPIYEELERFGMSFQSHFIWHKSNPAPCLHRRMFTHANEILLIYSKGKKWTFNYDFSKTLHGKQHHNVLTHPATKKIAGVTTKPIKLCEYIVGCLSAENDVVLDPFAGSFSLPIAAFNMGRRAVGIEIDKKIYEEGCKYHNIK